MDKIICRFFALLLCACCLTACYRMPTEEDYSLIPSTNNASLTREGPNSFIPNIGY